MDEVDRLRGDIVEYTRDMVRIPSENPPGNRTEISDYVSELLASLGSDVEALVSFAKIYGLMMLDICGYEG